LLSLLAIAIRNGAASARVTPDDPGNQDISLLRLAARVSLSIVICGHE
jgi:hypothetical protein